MDLSSYKEEEFEKELQKIAVKETPLKSTEVKELTEEAKNLYFYDFDKHKEFVGTFQGEGQQYEYNDMQINTWCFHDTNGLPWLIPQWEDMNRPQPVKDTEALTEVFKGFQHEKPNEYMYLIIYNDIAADNNRAAHTLSIYRKKI